MKVSVTTDVTEFKQLLLKLHATVPTASVEGVKVAMEELKHDCLEVEPRVPYESGFLAAHHEILPAKLVGTQIVGTLRVPGLYAASIHEGISRWGTPYKYKTPGTGAKWIQSKLLKYGPKYVGIMELVAKKALK